MQTYSLNKTFYLSPYSWAFDDMYSAVSVCRNQSFNFFNCFITPLALVLDVLACSTQPFTVHQPLHILLYASTEPDNLQRLVAARFRVCVHLPLSGFLYPQHHLRRAALVVPTTEPSTRAQQHTSRGGNITTAMVVTPQPATAS
jgi:hypothetical protein